MGSSLGSGETMKVGPANISASSSGGGLGFLSDRSAEGARLAGLLLPFQLPLDAARPTRSPLLFDAKRPIILSLTQFSLNEARPGTFALSRLSCDAAPSPPPVLSLIQLWLDDARPGFLPLQSCRDAYDAGEGGARRKQLVGGNAGVGNSGGRAAATGPAIADKKRPNETKTVKIIQIK